MQLPNYCDYSQLINNNCYRLHLTELLKILCRGLPDIWLKKPEANTVFFELLLAQQRHSFLVSRHLYHHPVITDFLTCISLLDSI